MTLHTIASCHYSSPASHILQPWPHRSESVCSDTCIVPSSAAKALPTRPADTDAQVEVVVGARGWVQRAVQCCMQACL